MAFFILISPPWLQFPQCQKIFKNYLEGQKICPLAGGLLFKAPKITFFGHFWSFSRRFGFKFAWKFDQNVSEYEGFESPEARLCRSSGDLEFVYKPVNFEAGSKKKLPKRPSKASTKALTKPE